MISPTPPAANTPHIARLDVLRALAFLAVFAFHLSDASVAKHVSWRSHWIDTSTWKWWDLPLIAVQFGALGVPLFFVLSGFCIHYSTLKRRGGFHVGDFYWRRILRLYPAYLVCVIFCSLVAKWMPYTTFSPWQVISHLLMIHNFFQGTSMELDGPMWSLGVEMQFYALYPLLLLVMRRYLSWGGCLIVALVINMICQVYFAWQSGFRDVGMTTTVYTFPLITWCDWILGAALAEAYLDGRRLFAYPAAWMGLSGLMYVMAIAYQPLGSQMYLFASVFFAALVQCYLAARGPLQVAERCLLPIGVISYSLYLWHIPVMFLSQRLIRTHGMDTTGGLGLLIFLTIVPALVFLASWLSYHALEVALPAWIRARTNAAAPAAPVRA